MDVAGGEVAAFASELRKLRALAGKPTYREMARSALYSPSVLSSAASGTRLPTLQVTLGFVAACGGDREQWRRRWMQVARTAAADPPSRTRPCGRPTGADLPRPAHLPWRCGEFVGRAAELARIQEHLAPVQDHQAPAQEQLAPVQEQLAPITTQPATPVLVTGPVGVGKTRFALEYAHQVAADLVDGQLYADLGTLRGTSSEIGQLLEDFLHALGLPADQVPHTVDQRAGLYRSLLADRRLLVLLDNVRDERQVRPLLVASRRSRTILVSRSRLLGLDGVARIRLDVLSRAEALAMIAASVPDRVATAPRECERLAALCGDLPLALDITLRKLTARPDLSLCEVTARLARPATALDWLRVGDLSLRAALRSAYQGLSADARTLLGRIARLSFRCDPEAVMRDGQDLAEELIDAGLLRDGDRPGSYRVGRLVRTFVLDAETPGDDPAPVPAYSDLYAGWPTRDITAAGVSAAHAGLRY
ncbi:NB-ARC domain-containing protein [Solwaraspora sp. WMMD791]|uniref:NB-ARC domain-containing protein n=1 Tax=Solwaraspora sp. WMMD791 TaxID=3016086 RepID=UPI00249B44E7|nr:NB-ARC domain-containing protein [Solwaraspora sp. WMMD791]WFE29622.1 NB-ARC domain-containing protein [Solwaraspora sp. WMMD791]